MRGRLVALFSFPGYLDFHLGYCIDDIVYMVEYMFIFPSGPEPVCLMEADVDNSGELDVGDLVYMVEYSFYVPAGPPPLDCF